MDSESRELVRGLMKELSETRRVSEETKNTVGHGLAQFNARITTLEDSFGVFVKNVYGDEAPAALSNSGKLRPFKDPIAERVNDASEAAQDASEAAQNARDAALQAQSAALHSTLRVTSAEDLLRDVAGQTAGLIGSVTEIRDDLASFKKEVRAETKQNHTLLVEQSKAMGLAKPNASRLKNLRSFIGSQAGYNFIISVATLIGAAYAAYQTAAHSPEGHVPQLPESHQTR